ncbi:MAG: hypothetical protein WCC57_06505, partial [Paracoccaceae bacterium]
MRPDARLNHSRPHALLAVMVFGCALLATSRDATAQIAFAGSGYNAASQGTKRPQTLVLEPR